jgi:hypothetical protein
MKRRSSDDKVIVEAKTQSRKERLVNNLKYIGMDVHKATTVVAVRNHLGKVIAEAIIETKGSSILAFLKSLSGTLPVYHGEHSTQPLKEFAQSYGAIVSDSTRVKNRIKALFRGRGIACTGTAVYDKGQHEQWLNHLNHPARRLRASRLFRQLDCLTELRAEAKKDLVAETRKHPATKILQSIPGIGTLRAGVIHYASSFSDEETILDLLRIGRKVDNNR